MKNITKYIYEKKISGNWKEEKDGKLLAYFLVFDEPSEEYGIDGGRISKLEIRDGRSGEVLCNYDRDWDVRVKDGAKAFYDNLIKKYN